MEKQGIKLTPLPFLIKAVASGDGRETLALTCREMLMVKAIPE